MAAKPPRVEHGTVSPADQAGEPVTVGSATWYQWLEQHASFAFVGPAGSFTARRDQAAPYWRAYRKRGGALRSAYLGRTPALTLERLEAVASSLAGDAALQLSPTAAARGPAWAGVGSPVLDGVPRTKFFVPSPHAQRVPRPGVIDALKAALKAAGWEKRPAPKAGARRTGSQPITGQGVSLVLRGGGPTLEGILGTTWMAAVAKVTVWPATGKVTVNEITMSYDCGLEVNPMAIRRCVEGGIVQGTSIALHEEVTFDKSNITSSDWNSYPILTMAETPKINVVLINRLDKGPGGGSEPAIMPALPAIHGAILDATGVVLHRTPFSPKYVMAALQA